MIIPWQISTLALLLICQFCTLHCVVVLVLHMHGPCPLPAFPAPTFLPSSFRLLIDGEGLVVLFGPDHYLCQVASSKKKGDALMLPRVSSSITSRSGIQQERTSRSFVGTPLPRFHDSMITYCMQSKTRLWEGLGTRLNASQDCSLHVA